MCGHAYSAFSLIRDGISMASSVYAEGLLLAILLFFGLAMAFFWILLVADGGGRLGIRIIGIERERGGGG